MRPFQDTEQRWSQLFSTSIGVDLRQAVRDGGASDPCENCLRSVCWKSFLLYGPLSRGSWSKKLSESRSAYNSLRDHFLKYINNPNDLHSSTDPLADDENSPWSSLRQDELSREEIFQDVTRCMQDNYFFKEPATQRRLLDILFIYSKLNPDTGYRQGMHELLAPILWVINQDAIDASHIKESDKIKEGIDFMLEVLDKRYIEHDAFGLFCAVMQTAKTFYEIGENKDSASIVAQSNRIHDELLNAVDPDLAHHLQVVGVLPQIYSIRWIRLLFGREFEFKDVLKVWDLLFAEGLTFEIIDMTCVAMLLRVHWQLIDADYTSAITSLTKFSLPAAHEASRSLVRDAMYLTRNLTSEGGADIIQRHSGQRPKYAMAEIRPQTPATPVSKQPSGSWSQGPQSSKQSQSRFNTPQKQLENLFQEVSGNLQRRTEGWTKTVRGAVGGVRKNMNNFQATHSRSSSTAGHNNDSVDPVRTLQEQLQALEARNKALAKMLDSTLESLRTYKPRTDNNTAVTEDAFNLALARIQFVSVYLADSDIAVPNNSEVQPQRNAAAAESIAALEGGTKGDEVNMREPDTKSSQNSAGKAFPKAASKVGGNSQAAPSPIDAQSDGRRVHLRPSLTDPSFSFMLGEGRKRSSFVTSVSDLPEQRRGSHSSPKPDQAKPDSREKRLPQRDGEQLEDDGFTLSPLG